MLFSFGLCCAFSFHAVRHGIALLTIAIVRQRAEHVLFELCACIQVPAYGALGIIAANCLNLALRIAFSLHFITTRVPTPAGRWLTKLV